jgi:hypothetical protein
VDEAYTDLLTLADAAPASFIAVGQLTGEANGTAMVGVVTIAVEGERFRVSIIDRFGQSGYAAAGSRGGLLVVDPFTGQKQFFTGPEGESITLGPIEIPAAVIPTLVTGAPPRFGRIDQAYAHQGERVAKTFDPAMTVTYRVRLSSVQFGSRAALFTITPGPLKVTDQMVSVTTVSITGGVAAITATIVWERVEIAPSFPAGFFSFSDDVFIGSPNDRFE